MYKKVVYLLFASAVWTVSFNASAAVPNATVTGPIAADPQGHPSRNSIYSSSAINLEAQAYIEEEYFIEGTANRYTTPEMETGEIIDSGHPYRTRIIVRRPTDHSRFSGIVIVEWINVTGGPDKDIDWWLSGEHFMRRGHAYVVVSAQQMGIDTMRQWSPVRYASLDTTDDGNIKDDELSYDIFAAAAKTIQRSNEQSPAVAIDILDGLRAEQLIATGHSQSASRLATYINHIHPLEPIFDGFMVHGGGFRLRDEQPVKLFKIMSETDMQRRAADPQPDTDNFRQWEVAGSSHVDVDFEVEFTKVRLQREGLPIEGAAPRQHECELPTLSRVPFRNVLNAAYDHLVTWIAEDLPPPVAPRLKLRKAIPTVEFERDKYGNVQGGIRLAEHVVATARNTGMNTGNTLFCFLYGSHEPFDQDTLDALYPSHAQYLQAVTDVVKANLEAGYILPRAAERTIRKAEASSIGK